MSTDNNNLLKRRIRLAKVISTLLIGLPFVRCIILNGSLAQGKAKRSSDIDLLIIAKRGHIFTVRFITIIMVWLTGTKRSSNETKFHGGKVCLNYFLTDEFLIIPHNRGMEINKYCAENYSSSLLLAGDQQVFDKFMALNMEWMEKYLQPTSRKKQETNKSQTVVIARSARRGNLKMQFNNLTIRQLVEPLLSGKFGNRVETWLKRIQLDRINRDPRTNKYPDLIVVDDNEMRFHPPKNSDPTTRGLDLERKQ